MSRATCPGCGNTRTAVKEVNRKPASVVRRKRYCHKCELTFVTCGIELEAYELRAAAEQAIMLGQKHMGGA